LILLFTYKKIILIFFKGIIGWISTNHGRTNYRNPHNTGKVKVHSSSLAKGSLWVLVDSTPSDVWTKDVPSSWFSIDFGPHRRVTVSNYSLRHGGNYVADTLRSWELQGSIDGVNWKSISKHTNDTSLNGPYASHSWEIINSNASYRFFRVLQIGRNSSNRNFLVLSGFEFFGVLHDVTSLDNES